MNVKVKERKRVFYSRTKEKRGKKLASENRMRVVNYDVNTVTSENNNLKALLRNAEDRIEGGGGKSGIYIKFNVRNAISSFADQTKINARYYVQKTSIEKY